LARQILALLDRKGEEGLDAVEEEMVMGLGQT